VLKLSGICNVKPTILRNYLSGSASKSIPDFLPHEATDIRILKLSRVAGGINATYAFRLSFRHGKKKLMLRLILKLYEQEKIAKREYLTLRALERINFPVPHVYVLETSEQVLGGYFIIMEEVKGKNMHHYMKHLNNEETLNLIGRFAEALVTLHELKFDEMDLRVLEFPKNEYDYAEKQALREESWALDLVKNFEWATKWLENNAFKCPCNRYSLLHGDMNLKNFLITDTGRIVFLDWTTTEIGDSLKDVGYAYHIIREMKGANVAAHFLKQYITRSSRNIDIFALRFYLFSAGLREAMHLKAMVEKLAYPSTTMRIYGPKFLPLFPFVWWHFRSRYKRLRHFLRDMTIDYKQAMFEIP
jgi:aminoglycoside phosphotransferase (APT) family kinase protein